MSVLSPVVTGRLVTSPNALARAANHDARIDVPELQSFTPPSNISAMPPRYQTLPAAATSSAREARQAFHCSLCNKGYSRMNDYEAHLSSYDHSHKQRLRDM